ncbi:thioredoxin domain-containing protein [Anaerovorax odorimutans]|uniref:Thioredoxin domain-containing protein n=1 Tax=Anaerovorax odorimutans TaxID=109327 RepID=A0ABT1RJS6_9FIRM|nr:thioredoxin domain-containing protein [Anaerovorax odorimutans]MCQ4635438.1 thioredoxin domain-containing protein [Anaerovorax odorimutans]
MNNQKTVPNRLANEKSPYLLQHANNPVNWYPWSEEAFDKAQEEDKPVFLSIGYSTCHWCHVMARESFEDEEVAQLLNRDFVSIKVDREERPDIDSVYMSVCQALTGSGGWPLTIVMTPGKEPFFAGTYFPKRGRSGGVGMIELLEFIHEAWRKDKKKLIAEGQKITSFIKENMETDSKGAVSEDTLIEQAKHYFRKTFDEKWGGFGPMPKFPSPHNLLFLMEQRDEHSLRMAEKTLVQMYRGGLFDHIGGGFCRYSTDERWLAPHFEKMLYDNALLMLAYAQGYAETGNELYGKVAEKTAAYTKQELTAEEGAFYCGQDADSDGVEGKYYVFSPGEIMDVLGEEEGKEFCARFDITASGNFEGKSIPNRLKDPQYEAIPQEGQLAKLRQYRKERTNLHRDDKVLTGWNGLMIAALCRTARLLRRPEYLERAERAADFIWNNLQQNGYLNARWRQGHAAHAGTLEDYAFFAWGLLECYRSTFCADYLKRAIRIGERMLEQFFDGEHGGCFLYGKDSEQLFIRPKETYDGAMPSGNSVAALVMDRLAFYTGEDRWLCAKEKQREFMKGRAGERPAAHSFFLWQLSREKDDAQLICVSEGELTATQFNDFDTEVIVKTKANQQTMEEIAPFLREYPIPKEGAVYYLCRGQRCESPVKSFSELEEKYKKGD